jgi:hypothetical protein
VSPVSFSQNLNPAAVERPFKMDGNMSGAPPPTRTRSNGRICGPGGARRIWLRIFAINTSALDSSLGVSPSPNNPGAIQSIIKRRDTTCLSRGMAIRRAAYQRSSTRL